MTSTHTPIETREIYEIPWLAFAVGGLGGFILLLWVLIFAVTLLKPPQDLPLGQFGLYLPALIGGLLLIPGALLYQRARVGLRLTPDKIEFPRSKVSIPWSEVEEIELVNLPMQQPGAFVPLLALYLSPAGRNLTRGRRLPKSHLADRIEPLPDICISLRFAYLGYGPGIESHMEFAEDLWKRKLAAAGVVEETVMRPPPPSPDAPLERRDTSETGVAARVYVHDICGAATAITDRSFYWVTNPLRYTGGASICSQCGQAYGNTLRWADTGETIDHFRSRMWRRTPLMVKLLQLVIAPALIGGLAAVVVPAIFPPAPNVSPTVGIVIDFGVGFIVGFMAICLTPLAGVIPGLAGMKYHTYQ